MIYTISKIEEDVNYGCEERMKDDPVKAVVTLKADGVEKTVSVSEKYLQEKNIKEGDLVLKRGENQIEKIDF